MKPFLLPLLVFAGIDIGVIQGGIVGDADQRGTFCQTQIFHIFAKVDLRCCLHSIAPLSQRNDIEIPLQDIILGILLFKLQRTEDLQQFSAHSDLIIVRQIFNQLLRNGGSAVKGLVSQKQIYTGSGRAQPIHTGVIDKALILNGNTGVFQIGGNVLIADPNAVFFSVKLFQHLPLTGASVLIINHRGLIQCKAFHREVNLRRQIIFYIHGEDTDKHKDCQKANEKAGTENSADPAPYANTAFAAGFLIRQYLHLPCNYKKNAISHNYP